jgi:prepilin-type N-terminal cleavage/methylation domain-containing protein
MRRHGAGFTLIELVLAMALLGTMMLLLYSGLAFSLRSWDAGEANGRRTADRRIGENFLRRELAELFPMRWKDDDASRSRSMGSANKLSSSRRAPRESPGRACRWWRSRSTTGTRRERHLVMRRAMPDDEQKSFAPLESVQPTLLIAGVDSVTFEYFGAENDFNAPSGPTAGSGPTGCRDGPPANSRDRRAAARDDRAPEPGRGSRMPRERVPAQLPPEAHVRRAQRGVAWSS